MFVFLALNGIEVPKLNKAIANRPIVKRRPVFFYTQNPITNKIIKIFASDTKRSDYVKRYKI